MLMWLAEYLTQFYSGFNVFSYLTFRSILGVLTALLLSLYFGPKLIRRLQLMQIGQTVRDDGPESHLSKSGTPTMGGILILGSIFASTLMWADLSNRYVLVTLVVIGSLGAVGFVDDYRKVVRKNSDGLIARWKYFWQSVIALTAGAFLFYSSSLPQETALVVPFFKDVMPQLGLFYIVMAYFVIVGTSNAVNLTDGLDGLAIMPVMIAGGTLGVFYLYMSRKSGHKLVENSRLITEAIQKEANPYNRIAVPVCKVKEPKEFNALIKFPHVQKRRSNDGRIFFFLLLLLFFSSCALYAVVEVVTVVRIELV